MLLKHMCPVCGKIIPIDQSYCEEHNRHRIYDKTVRLEADRKIHDFYISGEWKAAQKATSDKYSGICLFTYYKRNEIVPFDEVHHIIPLRDNWDLRLEPGNLIPLSHTVHMFIEAEYRKGRKATTQAELFELKIRYEREFFAPRGI